MDTDRLARLRLFAALARVEETANSLADLAFSLDQDVLAEDDRLLRDYCARLSMNLQDSFQQLRVMVSKAT